MLRWLPLPAAVRAELSARGLEEVSAADVRAAAEKLALPAAEVERLVASVDLRDSWGESAADQLASRRKEPAVVTLSQELDALLGGGVRAGEGLVELAGAPGSGKTQVCMQLAANVQIPAEIGGADGSCAYLDTEGSFSADRFFTMASALSEHLKLLADGAGCTPGCTAGCTPGCLAAAVREKCRLVTPYDFLARMFLFRCFDATELLATVHRLRDFVVEKRVKLVVIDSVAFCFRHVLEDNYQERAQLMTDMCLELNSLNVAVICTNHLTYRPGQGYVPALGETWAHLPNERLCLERASGGVFQATLTKSPSRKSQTVRFSVDARGVRDVSA